MSFNGVYWKYDAETQGSILNQLADDDLISAASNAFNWFSGIAAGVVFVCRFGETFGWAGLRHGFMMYDCVTRTIG